jgi:hypothetical protein
MPSRLPGDHFGEFLQSYNVNDPSYRVNPRQHLALIENAILQNHEPRLVSLEDFKKEYDSELIPWKNSTATRLSQLEEYKSDWDLLKQEQKDFDAWIKQTEINFVDLEKAKLNVDDYKKERSSIDVQLKHHDAKLAWLSSYNFQKGKQVDELQRKIKGLEGKATDTNREVGNLKKQICKNQKELVRAIKGTSQSVEALPQAFTPNSTPTFSDGGFPFPYGTPSPADLMPILPSRYYGGSTERSRSHDRPQYADRNPSSRSGFTRIPEISVEISGENGRRLFLKPRRQDVSFTIRGGGGGW